MKTKETMEFDAEHEAELEFLGIVGGKSAGKIVVSKEDFRRIMERKDDHVEWDGHLIVPRNVAIFDITDFNVRMGNSMDVVATIATERVRSVTKRIEYVPIDGGTQAVKIEF